MSSERSVYFSWALDGLELQSFAGRPVIPLRDNRELSRLCELASIYGLTPISAVGRASAAAPHRYDGAVVCLGDEPIAAARLHAHLTGRELRIAHNVDELPTIDRIAVVVTMAASVTSQLLTQLYEVVAPLQSLAPGVVAGENAEVLRWAVIKSAIPIVAKPEPARRRVFVSPYAQSMPAPGPFDLRFDAESPARRVDGALRDDAGLVVLVTSSNSLDVNIARDALLCPHFGTYSGFEGGIPRCLEIGRCCRLPDRPMRRAAEQAGRIVGTAGLRGRMLLVSACSPMKVADGMIDQRYGFSLALFRDAHAGAVLANWYPTQNMGDESFLDDFINRISAGLSLGVALAAFNASEQALAHAAQFCLLGDPAFAVEFEETWPVASAPRAAVDSRFDGELPADTSVDFWDSFDWHRKRMAQLIDFTSKADPALDRYGAERALASLGSIAAMSTNGATEAQLRDAVASMSVDVLDFYARADTVSELPQPYTVQFHRKSTRCPYCLGPARLSSYLSRDSRREVRRTIECAKCGEVASTPLQPSFDLCWESAREGIVRLTARPRLGAAVLYVAPFADRTQTKKIAVLGDEPVVLPRDQFKGTQVAKIRALDGLQMSSYSYLFGR